jgi:hypothetical protein
LLFWAISGSHSNKVPYLALKISLSYFSHFSLKLTKTSNLFLTSFSLHTLSHLKSIPQSIPQTRRYE